MNLTATVVRINWSAKESRAWGEHEFNQTYESLEEARQVAEGMRAEGKCIILRPNYNEKDVDGEFFREWRSFDGEKFKECRFSL